MHRAALLFVILAVSVVAVPLGGAGSGAGGTDERPPNATTDVDVSLYPDPPNRDGVTIRVNWDIEYPARSDQEARRARNDTLNVSWFRGDEELREFAEAYAEAEVDDYAIQIHHTPSESQYGEISVGKMAEFTLQLGVDRERVVLGPQLAEALHTGDELSIRLANDWTPATVTTDAQLSGTRWIVYVWQIGEGPSPRFELNASGVPNSTAPSGGDLGTGPILSVVALALVVTLLAVGTKRRRR